ncbi:TOPRIM nucleotidyl transferase/hydrolase domain-containing protein [Ideonella sp. BN130291]|uniref:TOPRIM nucleotidyl transferase/hydrolase domain-containing protein n=1 Tax=Ideonella sp. BN130291 TaxID=3112940 RepID=UPI002E276EF8|nr:TOPRIM nucleotidyl transferase/hydrolase domain-containing protein [Ideonella sp. BN130291]
MESDTPAPTLVLVEGDSDAGAVRALAALIGCDLDMHRIQVRSAHGVTNFPRLLAEFVHVHPRSGTCGLYDVGEEWHVRRAIAHARAPIAADESLETHGFYACVVDLEDELIRALGPDAVEQAIQAQGELASFRRFQAMPQQRGKPAHDQLRRFLGTRATRKIRMAAHLVRALGVARLPRPLAQLAAHLVEAARERSGA